MNTGAEAGLTSSYMLRLSEDAQDVWSKSKKSAVNIKYYELSLRFLPAGRLFGLSGEGMLGLCKVAKK